MTHLSLGNIGFAPFNRALVGFDRMFQDIENLQVTNYPPHNIIKLDDENYKIEVAVAGFEKEDLSVEVKEKDLIIKGERVSESKDITYLYRGLASRSFEKTLCLSADIVVSDVELDKGILTINLERVIPEELKPRKLKIK